MGTNYIDTYDKQLNERKFALLRTLAGWWIAITKKKDEVEARAKVKVQIEEMRKYLNHLEVEIDMADIELPENEIQS